MLTLSQSPHDDGFVQNPYPLYEAARRRGPVLYWEEFAMPAVFDHATIHRLLRAPKLGREAPTGTPCPYGAKLGAFAALEAHSMLALEGARHKRLRALVLRAFTSARAARLAPQIEALCHQLIDRFEAAPFDLLSAYCTPVPAQTIAALLGVPGDRMPELVRWSNAMVRMYQPNPSAAIESAAETAARDFTAFLHDHIAQRRRAPGEDLISELIAVETEGSRLSQAELISTCVLLLNAGHEATVHALGNSIALLLRRPWDRAWLAQGQIAATVEELLRYDPPLHMFMRYVYEDIDVQGQTIGAGQEIALVLGAAGRDPQVWAQPDRFDPLRPAHGHLAFGGGVHFCLGAPLARLEMQIALRILFERCPELRLAEAPRYAPTYHFHGLQSLIVAQR